MCVFLYSYPATIWLHANFFRAAVWLHVDFFRAAIWLRLFSFGPQCGHRVRSQSAFPENPYYLSRVWTAYRNSVFCQSKVCIRAYAHIINVQKMKIFDFLGSEPYFLSATLSNGNLWITENHISPESFHVLHNRWRKRKVHLFHFLFWIPHWDFICCFFPYQWTWERRKGTLLEVTDSPVELWEFIFRKYRGGLREGRECFKRKL